jgi:nitrilase
MEVTIKHHALESGCFVVNATGWLTDEQINSITPDDRLRKALRGGCHTAIISPEGVPLCPAITEGEGMAIAELDPALITKRKRMMDSVGHYSRPDIFTLHINRSANLQVRSKNDDLFDQNYGGLPIGAPDEETIPAL